MPTQDSTPSESMHTQPPPHDLFSTPVKQPLMSPERAASPLLTEDPLSHLNIKLHAPLPHISPPGNIHAIHENTTVHPIPILLPPLSVPRSGSVEGVIELSQQVPNDEKSDAAQLDTTDATADGENSSPEKNSSAIYDI